VRGMRDPPPLRVPRVGQLGVREVVDVKKGKNQHDNTNHLVTKTREECGMGRMRKEKLWLW